MIKKILTYPEDKEILTQISEEIPLEEIPEKDIQDLIQDLKDTLNSTRGCGISAIQIGIPKKICVIKYNNKDYVLINPEITRTRGEVQFKEGCLSAPGISTAITRARKVWCSYFNEYGEYKELDQGGLMSVIIQHELDHFDGWCKVFDVI